MNTAHPPFDTVQSAIRTIEAEKAGLAILAAGLHGELGEALSAAVTRIRTSSGRVVVTGMGKSGHVGRKIAATFASTGTPSLFVHAAEAGHGDLGMIQTDDVVLALSWSGETAELKAIVGHAQRFRVTLIAITSNRKSALGQAADICLELPKAPEACPNGLAPTTSTTMQLALGDALAVALLEARGFSAQDFKVFHPGGKLGAQLRQVREVMHTGTSIPQVADSATMAEAVAQISAKGFGCTLVVDATGALVGIVTDGDLRRSISKDVLGKDLLNLPVSAIMSRNPRSVTPETLLAKALEIQETSKITALVVAENGRPVGIVHYLDLLKAGVA
jgi:arabinose-5-phosphate isomerase